MSNVIKIELNNAGVEELLNGEAAEYCLTLGQSIQGDHDIRQYRAPAAKGGSRTITQVGGTMSEEELSTLESNLWSLG